MPADPQKPDVNSPDFDPFADDEGLETLDLDSVEPEPDEAATQLGMPGMHVGPPITEDDPVEVIDSGEARMQVGKPIDDSIDSGNAEHEMHVGRPVTDEPPSAGMGVGLPFNEEPASPTAETEPAKPSPPLPPTPRPKKSSRLPLLAGLGVTAVAVLVGIAFAARSFFAGAERGASNGPTNVAQNAPPAAPSAPPPTPSVPTAQPPEAPTVPDDMATLPAAQQQEFVAGLEKRFFASGDPDEVAAAARSAREKATDPRVKTRLSLLEETSGSLIDNLSPPPRPTTPTKTPVPPETPPTPEPKDAAAPATNSSAALPAPVFLWVCLVISQQPPAAPANLDAEQQQSWNDHLREFEDVQVDPYFRAAAAIKLAGMCYEAGDFAGGESLCAQALSICDQARRNPQKEHASSAGTPEARARWTKLVDEGQRLRLMIQVARQDASLHDLRVDFESRLDRARGEAATAQTALKTVSDSLATTQQELVTTKKTLTDTTADSKKQLETLNTDLAKASKEVKDQVDLLSRNLPAQALRSSVEGYFKTLDVAGRWQKLQPQVPAGASPAELAEHEKRLADWTQRQTQLEQIRSDLEENRLTSSVDLAAAQFKLQEISQLAVVREQPKAIAVASSTPGSASPLPSDDLLTRLDRLQTTLRGESAQQVAALRKDIAAQAATLKAHQEAQVATLQGNQQSQLAQLRREVDADIRKALSQPHPLPDAQLGLVSDSVTGAVIARLESYGFMSPARRGSIVPAGGAEVPRNPRQAQECFAAGYHLYFSNSSTDLAQAGRLFAQAVEADPHVAAYRYFLGLTLYRQGQHPAALTQVRTGADLEGRTEYERESIATALERVQGAPRAWLDRVRSEI